MFVALVFLTAGFRGIAQEFPFAPGVLDRIQAVIETFGGGVSKKTTNTLAPNALLQITDSTFPLSGQSIKIQFEGSPPVQPILDGTLRFNFPAVTPERDSSGVFQPPLPASVTFDGTWTKGDFNYPMGEAVSYSAAQVLLTAIQPTACPNTATARVRTGAPIPVGVNPVSVSASCDMKSLSGLGGSDPVETEHAASGVLQIIAGDGGAGDNPIFSQVGATVVYHAVYKSRRRPEITINTASTTFAHTDGQPLPAARTLILTNTGGLTLNWTAKATNHSPTSVGTPTWLKISTTGGSLDSLGTQPIEFSVDPTGLAAGSYSARVTFEGNTWNGSKTLFVTLNFTGVPRLSVTPASFEFFNTVAFPQQTLTLKNEGTLRLIPELVVTSETNWLDAPRFIGSLDPGQSSTITVRASQFPPPNFTQIGPGDYSGQILIKPADNQPAQHDFPPVMLPAVFHVLVPRDELAILPGSVTPSTNDPIQLDTEYANFKAGVTYQVGTRNDADLALRLFDEQGNLQATSDFIRVFKSDGLVASRSLTLPKFKLTPDALGKVPEKLILRAVLIDRSLQTPFKSTSETEYVYSVESAIKLTLGHGTKLEDFQAEFPAELRAGSFSLGQANWPTAAVVELPRSAGVRGVNLTARLFRADGLSRFYTTLNTVVPAGFEGRLFLDLTQVGFNQLPIECMKHRADFVQVRANVVIPDTATVSESPQLQFPVERVNFIAADPPFGSTLPRSDATRIKLTVEYNVPNFGPRRIHHQSSADSGCFGPDLLLLRDETLGPGRGTFTYEVTPDLSGTPAERSHYKPLLALREQGVVEFAQTCLDDQVFQLADRITLPPTPDQTVTTASAALKIVTNPTTSQVDASISRQSLAALAADSPAAPAARPVRASLRRHAGGPLGLADLISVNQVWSFDPPVPAGAGFSADLSLRWTPEIVPDDPNVSEASLKILSFNPANGALRSHETTVDVTTRTATARVDSLESYYTLGVVGPFAQRVVNLPLPTNRAGLTARVNVSAGSQASGFSLTAYAGNGWVILGESNPLIGFMAAHASLSLTVPALFGLHPPLPDAWMQGVVKADYAALLRLEQPNAAEMVQALPAFPRLLVPGLEHNAARTTELRLANPTRFDTSVSLELRNDDGTSAGTFNAFLGARNALAGSLGEFFPGLPASFTGYVVVQGDTDLVAVALLQSSATLAVISGQPSTGETPATLVAPAFATGGVNHRARLALANPGSHAAALTLRLVGDDGANLAAPINVNLAAGRQYRAELGEAFGLSAAAVTTGSLIVEGDVGGLAGELTQLDAGAGDLFRASQLLLDVPATRHHFAHFDNTAGRFTELSLFNPGAAPAAVTVSVLRADGSTLGAAPFLLAGGSRMTRRLSESIPASASLTGESFVVESSEPVFASALTGEDSLNTLAAIPAHTGEAVAPPEPPGPLKADYQFADVLTSSVAGAPPLAHLGEGNAFAGETVDGVDRLVLRFPHGNGLSLPAFTDLVASNTWSVVLLFRLETTTGYRRLLDLWNFTSDYGLYCKDGVPYYYNEAFSGIDAIKPGVWTQVVLTRAADNTVAGYADGRPIFQFNDASGKALPTAGNNLVFFRDNNGEESAGAVARIRLYDTALTAGQVTALDRLAKPPEPPALAVTVTPSQLVLSWPANATGFILQSAPGLASPINWQPVANPVVTAGDRKSVTLDLANAAGFFRLASP